MKLANLSIEALFQSLNQALSPLYVIHGEEDLLRIECLDALREACQRQGYTDKQVYTIDSNHFDWNELLAEAASSGLFSDLKLLEIHIPSGKTGKAGSDALQQLAEHLPQDTVCVIVLPKLERQQYNAKWFTALSQVGQIIETKAIGAAQLPQWIRTRLQKYGLSIDEDALSLFAERVEGNLLAAKQEIDKLSLLYPEGYSVQLSDAEQAIANVARFDIFQLSSAWMGQDLPRLSKLLDSFEAEGEEPVLLLWALTEDIRTLIRLAAALKQGKTIQQLRNELRLWGDKQFLAAQAVKRISVARLMNALESCAQIDRQIKGAESGNAWNHFKTLIMSLAA